MTAARPEPTQPPTSGSLTTSAPVFWACAVVGAAMMYFGLHSVLRTSSTPIYWVGRWMISLLLVHDVIVTIAAGVTGWLLARWLPDWLSGPVRGAIALTAIVVVFSFPLWHRRGVDPKNLSRLPLNYATAVLTVVAAVWCAAAVMAARRWWQQRARTQ